MAAASLGSSGASSRGARGGAHAWLIEDLISACLLFYISIYALVHAEASFHANGNYFNVLLICMHYFRRTNYMCSNARRLRCRARRASQLVRASEGVVVVVTTTTTTTITSTINYHD